MGLERAGTEINQSTTNNQTYISGIQKTVQRIRKDAYLMPLLLKVLNLTLLPEKCLLIF